MNQCHAKIDLVKYMWVSDLYFMVHLFCLRSLSDFNYFNKLRNGVGRGIPAPPGTCSLVFMKILFLFMLTLLGKECCLMHA